MICLGLALSLLLSVTFPDIRMLAEEGNTSAAPEEGSTSAALESEDQAATFSETLLPLIPNSSTNGAALIDPSLIQQALNTRAQ